MKKTKGEVTEEYEKLEKQLEYYEEDLKKENAKFEKIEEDIREVENEYLEDQKKAKE
jgi:hypothetical protein